MKMEGTQYYLVYCDIITEIYSGKWKKGDMLPNLESICKTYNIGRNTARTVVSLLEENGYIVKNGKHQPRICFDWEDESLRKRYIGELAARQEAIDHVFAYMTLVMPELFSYFVSGFTDGKRREIIDRLEAYRNTLHECTEKEMSAGLIQIYMDALAFIGNDLLYDLFQSLYYFIQVPLEQETRRNIKFRTARMFIKYMMRRFQKQIEENRTAALAEQIRFFCQNLRQNTGNYLSRICEGVEVKEQRHYRWIPREQTEYLQVALDIIGGINKGIYQAGVILPSYVQLAEQYQVSEKTSRNAVKALNEWEVAATVNGVGTKVHAVGETECRRILQGETVQRHIQGFLEALQIFILTCRPVIREAAEHKTQEAPARTGEELSYRSLISFIFVEHEAEVVRDIYGQLTHFLKWGEILEICGIRGMEKESSYIMRLWEMLRERKGDELAECIYRDFMEYDCEVRKFLKEISEEQSLHFS